MKRKMTSIIKIKKISEKQSNHIISESVTPDPEVANQDNITLEYSYHNDLPHSVQNGTQEPKLPLENQQSPIINQNNISKSVSKSQAPSINSTLDIKVNKQFIESNEQLTRTPNLAVANHDNITIESSYHNNTSHSIQNIKQEPEVEPDNHDSSLKIQNSIFATARESQVSKANSEKIEGIIKQVKLLAAS